MPSASIRARHAFTHLYIDACGRARSAIVLICVVSSLALCACDGAQARLTVLRGATMGTHYSVKIVDLPQSLTEGALGAEVDAAFADVDARMSTYRDDSEVSRFNASTSVDWQEISPGLLEVLRSASAG
jgi:thiamine biosynthesis lipoprotein